MGAVVQAKSLPPSLPPRGLSRPQAAAYLGISPTKFDELVRDGLMPMPKQIGTRKIWDIRALDEAFAALPDCHGESDSNPWDE
jgi:predicted DNA-binding transcriptional regulator AlpA